LQLISKMKEFSTLFSKKFRFTKDDNKVKIQ
jgi:hypothetical protein